MKKTLFAAFAAVCITAAVPVAAQQYKTTPKEVATAQSEYLNHTLSLDREQTRMAYKQCLRIARLQQKTGKASRAAARQMKGTLDERQFHEWQRIMSNFPKPNAFGYPHPERVVMPHTDRGPADRPAGWRPSGRCHRR